VYTNDGKPESAIAYSKLDYWMETEDGSWAVKAPTEQSNM
jgi:hypothetical protein